MADFIQNRRARCLTLERNEKRAKLLDVMQAEVAEWIQTLLLCEPILPEFLLNKLKEGVMLCDVLTKIERKVTKSRPARNLFFARENIQKFLKGAKRCGVREECLFEANDLIERRNDWKVVNCLMELAKQAASKFGVVAPLIIQYEQEIAEDIRKEKERKLESDRVDDLAVSKPPTPPSTRAETQTRDFEPKPADDQSQQPQRLSLPDTVQNAAKASARRRASSKIGSPSTEPRPLSMRLISPSFKTTSPSFKTTSPSLKTTSPSLKTFSPSLKTFSPSFKTTSPSSKPRPLSMQVISPSMKGAGPSLLQTISPTLKTASSSLVKDTVPSSKPAPPLAKTKGRSLKTRLKVGQQVTVTRADGSIVRGQVRFIGKTKFHPGRWVGVALTTPSGKNDGTVRGESYFKCTANHGLFLRPSQVRAFSETTRAGRSKVDSQSSASLNAKTTHAERSKTHLKQDQQRSTVNYVQQHQTNYDHVRSKVDCHRPASSNAAVSALMRSTDAAVNTPFRPARNDLLDKKIFTFLKEQALEASVPIQRVCKGKYKINSKIVYIREVRNVVLVRVGGGWQAFEDYVMKLVLSQLQSSKVTHLEVRNLDRQ